MAKCGCSGSTCNCVVQAGDGVTVTGAGTAANPYIVAADPSDVVTVADTATVNMTKTGNVITSDVIVDPVAGNALVAGPAGLSVPCESIQDCVGQGFDDGLVYDDVANQFRVRLSTDGGNVLTFGTDNGVYGPASPVDIGCGLTNGPGGEIIADVVPFGSLTRRTCTDTEDDPPTVALDAGCEAQGMAIYCGADGALRTKPEKFTETETASSNEAFAPPITAFTPAPVVVGNTVTMSVTNPSSCYCLCGELFFAFIAGISGAGGTVISVFHEVDLGSGVFSAVTGFVMDNRGKSAASGHLDRPQVVLPVCLDPGETKVFRYRVSVERFTGDNNAAVSMTSLAKVINFVGTSL